MFHTLLSSVYIATPIKLTYLNENRDFYGDFTLSGDEEYFQFQDELSAIEDISIAFDSVHFLTDVRDRFTAVRSDLTGFDANIGTASTLAVFNEDMGIDCENVKNTCGNYWVTLPVAAYTMVSGECIGQTNVVALKNNFSETHQTTCTPCYRNYTQFNFGANGVDNLKPELLFRTSVDIQYFDKTQTEFEFSLPDFSESISGDEIPDFNCFGALGGSCPTYTDNIKWYPEGTTQPVYSWLKGDACSGVWVDRYINQDGSTTDVTPTQMTLHSSTPYTYIRPNNEQIEELRASIAESDETIFSFDGVSGDQILDQSPNQLNGKYV